MPASQDKSTTAMDRGPAGHPQPFGLAHRPFACARNAAAYAELNPVRAGMVESAWAFAWSRAAAHYGEEGDPAGLQDLGGWFEAMTASESKVTLTPPSPIPAPRWCLWHWE